MLRDDVTRRWNLLIALALIALAAASRLAPHPWNATPMMATALFAGATLASPVAAIATMLGALVAGDLALGLFPYPGLGWVYGAMIVATLLGRLLQRRGTPTFIAATAVGSGLVFFVISNFGVWLGGALYPKTVGGLATCYIAGLPFYRNQLLGDLFFTAILFGAYAGARRLVAARAA